MVIDRFATPGWLGLLVVVAALAACYVLAQRRRRRHAPRFANLSMLERVAPGCLGGLPGWQRRKRRPLTGVLDQLNETLAGEAGEDGGEPRRMLRDVGDHTTRVVKRIDGFRELLGNILSVNAALVAQRQTRKWLMLPLALGLYLMFRRRGWLYARAQLARVVRRVGGDVGGIRERRVSRAVGVGAAVVVGVVLLAGCAGAAPARPVPTVTLDPLDVSAFAAAPCDLLRADRAARRHLAVPGTVTAGPEGPVCRWTPTEPRVPIYTAGVAAHTGLTAVSAHRGDFSFYDQTSIAHYPALHTRDRGAGSSARCSTRVGVADDSQVIVTADDNGVAVPSALDACSEADILATEIMGQLLAGSG